MPDRHDNQQSHYFKNTLENIKKEDCEQQPKISQDLVTACTTGLVDFFICGQWQLTFLDNFRKYICRQLGNSMSNGITEVHLVQSKFLPVNILIVLVVVIVVVVIMILNY
jgi:hypothetical protein